MQRPNADGPANFRPHTPVGALRVVSQPLKANPGSERAVITGARGADLRPEAPPNRSAMTLLRQNITFALRGLRRRPGFAGIAITTIALGIGAATAIYSVVDGVVFRPPRQQSRATRRGVANLPAVAAGADSRQHVGPHPPLHPGVSRLACDADGVQVVAISAKRRRMTSGVVDRREMVAVTRPAPLLCARRVAGDGPYFTAQEDVLGGPPVAMVTYEGWLNRYQRDRSIVGRSVRLNDHPYTIVGVLPEGLTLSRTVSASGVADFWTPVGQEADDANQRGNHSYLGLARLKPGVTLQHAAQETDRILRGDASPDKRGVRLEEWQSDQTRTVRKPFRAPRRVGALVIACIDVAVLLLGEAWRVSRRSPHDALGAGRTRIIAQLLTESVALAVVGAVAGTALAWAGTRALVALAPPRVRGSPTWGWTFACWAFARCRWERRSLRAGSGARAGPRVAKSGVPRPDRAERGGTRPPPARPGGSGAGALADAPGRSRAAVAQPESAHGGRSGFRRSPAGRPGTLPTTRLRIPPGTRIYHRRPNA